MPEENDALISVFVDEALQRLDVVERGVRALADQDLDAAAIHDALLALHTIKGSAACLDFDDLARSAHDAEGAIERAGAGADSLADLTTSIADLSGHIERLAHSAAPCLSPPSKLAEVVENAVRLARRRAERTQRIVTFEVSVPADLAMPASSARALAQALLHVLNNAIDHAAPSPDESGSDFTPASLTVSIDARPLGPQGRRISVADDGPGIDREGLRRTAHARGVPAETADALGDDLALEPGITSQADPSLAAGRGLGLAAAAAAIARIGGNLTLESCPGEGTTVHFDLPGVDSYSEEVDKPQ